MDALVNVNGLSTITQISDFLDEPPQRVAYIVRKHRIKAVEHVGIIRLFNFSQVKAWKEVGK